MNCHLAQINIARLMAPLDDPRIAEFVAELGPINTLADNAPGLYSFWFAQHFPQPSDEGVCA